MYLRLRLLYLFNMFDCLDPVRLSGEGQYNLHSLQEIAVTDSFLGLDRVTRNCQTLESFEDCKTQLYLQTMRDKCRCLPLSINLSDKVKIKNFHHLQALHYITG